MNNDAWFDAIDPFDEDPPFDNLHNVKQRKPSKIVQPDHWQSADGRVIAFRDMEHAHLLNTIAYLERRYRETQDTFCDQALDIDLLYPAHAGLAAEARHRGLIPKSKRQLVTSGF